MLATTMEVLTMWKCVLLVLCLCVCASQASWISDSTEDVIEDVEDPYDAYLRNPLRQSIILVGVPEENFRPMQDQEPIMPDDRENEVIPSNPTVPAKTPLDILSEKVDNLMSEVKSQQDIIKVLETANSKMTEKVDQIEQQIKANNLIFLNVRENKNESHKTTLQKVLQVVNRMMKIRLNANDISLALRVESENFNKTRPIVVKFNKFSDKMKVLAGKAKLKKSTVDITSDYSELVNLRRKELLPFLLEKRRQGHNAFLLYDKLLVDGVKLTLEELKEESRREEVEEALDQVWKHSCFRKKIQKNKSQISLYFCHVIRFE